MNGVQEANVHATAVALDPGSGPVGVLLRGVPGSGKSDLALRLIDGGATLIADDRTVLRRAAGRVLMAPSPVLRGRLEVRGLGLVPVDHVADVPLVLVVDLVEAAAVERLPAPRRETLLDVAVPVLALAPFECSAPAKVRLAVRSSANGILHKLD
jgi:HPr kinase/phosphorylase